MRLSIFLISLTAPRAAAFQSPQAPRPRTRRHSTPPDDGTFGSDGPMMAADPDAEFAALLAAHPGRLEVIHHLDATQGIIKPEEIVAAMKGFEAGDVYLCGPGPFMKLVEETLFEHGMPHDKVRIERFEASGNDAVPVEPSEEGDVIPSEITIHFEGKVHKVPYAKGQTILEAARAGGRRSGA